MSRILCIETATHLCSVAVSVDGATVAARDAEDRERFLHAERLNVLVEDVLKEAGLGIRDLQAVAVGIGPGSYTGLRIGLSAAKGFCYALGIPIIGIGTLETLVQAMRGMDGPERTMDNEVLHPMIDARRMEVFTGESPRSEMLDESWIGTLDPARKHLVFGDGADKATEFWSRHRMITHRPGIKPWARAMVRIAAGRHASGRTDDLAYLVPMYGKEARVTSPPRGG